jgi:DNA mismatch repair protein MutS
MLGELPELLQWPEDTLADASQAIIEALVEDPPVSAKEGGLFRRGLSDELDELITLAEGGKTAIAAMEAQLRERTGIGSLKVRYNRVHGYYIEVTRANLQHVPEDFRRKQTLVNAERFVTPELADHELKVLGAEERRNVLEQRLFEQLRGRVAAYANRLTAAAERVAMLDVLCGLAEVAQRNDYVRPEVDESLTIAIEQGRHPVVERFMAPGRFVPNDSVLDEATRLLILTGPNMAGKSTVIRQVALITLMAQLGSFVPCRKARIGVVDRIFTRVGASDNLARGESTFMVEMRETATILRHASARSLVVLDEIGRGTSTYDGISIAWAVAEYLHDRVRCRAMFATHYHEMCQLAEVKPHVRNFTVAVEEAGGEVVFVHRLLPGASSRSYGIEVARLAGLVPAVLQRARQVLAALEGTTVVDDLPLGGRTHPPELPQLSLLPQVPPAPAPAGDRESEALVQALRAVEVEQMTPIEALNQLDALVKRARRGAPG